MCIMIVGRWPWHTRDIIVANILQSEFGAPLGWTYETSLLRKGTSYELGVSQGSSN
jgi:hypothetical protein